MCTVVQIWNLSAGGQRLKTRKSLEIMGWPTFQMDEAPGSAREPVSKNMEGCKQERHPILISASICTCLKIWTHTLTHVEHTCVLTHTHTTHWQFFFPPHLCCIPLSCGLCCFWWEVSCRSHQACAQDGLFFLAVSSSSLCLINAMRVLCLG